MMHALRYTGDSIDIAFELDTKEKVQIALDNLKQLVDKGFQSDAEAAKHAARKSPTMQVELSRAEISSILWLMNDSVNESVMALPQFTDMRNARSALQKALANAPLPECSPAEPKGG